MVDRKGLIGMKREEEEVRLEVEIDSWRVHNWKPVRTLLSKDILISFVVLLNEANNVSWGKTVFDEIKLKFIYRASNWLDWSSETYYLIGASHAKTGLCLKGITIYIHLKIQLDIHLSFPKSFPVIIRPIIFFIRDKECLFVCLAVINSLFFFLHLWC